MRKHLFNVFCRSFHLNTIGQYDLILLLSQIANFLTISGIWGDQRGPIFQNLLFDQPSLVMLKSSCKRLVVVLNSLNNSLPRQSLRLIHFTSWSMRFQRQVI